MLSVEPPQKSVGPVVRLVQTEERTEENRFDWPLEAAGWDKTVCEITPTSCEACGAAAVMIFRWCPRSVGGGPRRIPPVNAYGVAANCDVAGPCAGRERRDAGDGLPRLPGRAPPRHRCVYRRRRPPLRRRRTRRQSVAI